MADWWVEWSSTFTTQDWFSFWAVVVALIGVVTNVGITAWNSWRVGRRLRTMDESIEEGLDNLDAKVSALDWNYAYILGVLDGADIPKGRGR